MNKKLIAFILVLLTPFALFASHGEGDLTHRMTDLVIKLGVIIIAGRLGGMTLRKLNLPSVLGELLAGIALGPFLLGTGGVLPELQGFSTIASILLLFYAGLETDLGLFLKFAVTGTIVGLGGAILSFLTGDLLGMALLQTGFMDPRALFFGILSTATSVGITARILSEHKKIDSPEGVTILAAAVIDDVIGIILLAVVLGIAALSSGSSQEVSATAIGLIALKAIGAWLGFTIAGLLLAKPLSRFLKKLKDTATISVFSFALALILAGYFEKFGLAMIIGAYTLGLSLSKTDLSYVIQEKLHSIYHFLVPLFFTIMGLMVDVRDLFSPKVAAFGMLYALIAVLAKVIGAGGPALFMNFNPKGALRIGVGMVPRGEVALIIVGLGLSSGVLDQSLFSMAIIMTLVTTIAAPPLLNRVLKSPGRGVKKEDLRDTTTQTVFECSLPEMADMAARKIIHNMEAEEFYVNIVEGDQAIYQLRKNDIFMSMKIQEDKLLFETSQEDVGFIKTLFFESILEIQEVVGRIHKVSKPASLKKELMTQEIRKNFDYQTALAEAPIEMDLKGETKEKIIRELIALLEIEGKLKDPDTVIQAVFDREAQMSTGMQYGIALPHGKTHGVDRLITAVGIKRSGVDFNSIDGEPSQIFILVISPEGIRGPHIQFLSSISSVLQKEEARKLILSAGNPEQIRELLGAPIPATVH